jgi:flagellar hook-associated protein 1 FlgK
MSLNGIVGNALSGLQAAQLGMRTASNNVANANTPGYARTEINQTARNAAGQGMGVEIRRRSARRRSLSAGRLPARRLRRLGSQSALAATLDRLQAQFGAPDDEGALFGRLNQAFSSLGSAATDSAERVARLSAASDLQSFFDEVQRLSTKSAACAMKLTSASAPGLSGSMKSWKNSRP